jgi:hypothetical protein
VAPLVQSLARQLSASEQSLELFVRNRFIAASDGIARGPRPGLPDEQLQLSVALRPVPRRPAAWAGAPM